MNLEMHMFLSSFLENLEKSRAEGYPDSGYEVTQCLAFCFPRDLYSYKGHSSSRICQSIYLNENAPNS